MSENCQDALNCRPEDLQYALSIHTQKITDSCRDKDCIEDLRVWLTQEGQTILDTAASAKVRCAELIYTSVDVSPVTFNRNQYYIDLTFYYRIHADTSVCSCRPAAIYGLATFSKRAVLCGENAGAHIFTSDGNSLTGCATLPPAVVEVLDPMVLSSRLISGSGQDIGPFPLPEPVRECFDGDLVISGNGLQLLVTLGQFSIIRLQRPVQLVVPVLDYSIPTKECCDSPGCAEDPCQVFSRIPFPTSQFTPTGCANGHVQGCDSCRGS